MMNTENLCQQAREKHLSGDTQEAIILLTQAISSNPKDVNIALDMVQIFLDIGETGQAQSLFARLPEQAKKTDMGLAISSQLNFILLAQNTAGTSILRAQVSKNTDNYQAHFDLAVCLFSEHDIEQGMENLFFIQENNPDFREGAAKEMIGVICNMLASSNLEESGAYRRRLANLVR